MSSVTSNELARRTNATSLLHITRRDAAMFVGYWLEHNIVEKVLPGRYRLTEHGQRVAAGLLDTERDEALIAPPERVA